MTKSILIAGSLLLLATASTALAGPHGWGPGGPYGRLFDPKSVETVTGRVTKVDKVTPMRGMSYGIEIVVKTDKETIAVHLGPGWFVDNQETKIAIDDEVEVRGFRVTMAGKPTLIASSVRKGDAVLQLRDDAGYQTWAAWRRPAAAPR